MVKQHKGNNRREMAKPPVRVLDMCARLSDLGTVVLHRIDEVGVEPHEVDAGDHQEVYRYVSRFELYVSERLCHNDFQAALETDLSHRERLKDNFNRFTYQQLHTTCIMMPVSGELAGALEYLAEQQGVKIPDITKRQRSWVMFALDKRKNATDKPRRQLDLVRLERYSISSDRFVVYLTPAGPIISDAESDFDWSQYDQQPEEAKPVV